LALLYALIDIFKVHYLLSASIAFLTAFFISFYLQKFWTFRDNSREKIYKQISLYFAVGATNLCINAAGMYVLVEHVLPELIIARAFNATYVAAQIIMGIFIAVASFLIYRFVIFSARGGSAFGGKKFKEKTKNAIGNKLKVLIATGIFPPDIGGPATYVRTLCEELPKLGCEVKVVTYGNDEIPNPKLQTINSIIYKISRRQNLLFRYFKYFWQVFKLCKWADVVYVQGPVSEGLPSWLACKLRGKKYVLKIVGDYAWEQGSQRFSVKELLDDFQRQKYCWQVELMRRIQRLVADGSQSIVVPSKYLKRIINEWGIGSNKINVIYNSVKKIDLSISKERARSELNLTGDVILSSGRLVTWKGFGLLIGLMPELLAVNPDFRLIIIGEGPEKNKLEVRSKKLEISDNVKCVGSLQQDELWKYMRASDIFVLNTGYEGLPHIVIEAMQLGLPVITTNVGGNPEVVEDGQTGVLVEYNNKEQIKNAILEMRENKESAEKLANEAKISLLKFNKEIMINNILKILRYELH
ncbi:glycosyltransferase, partial [Candidatus Parcubacteria bacterium]|nr:glycosyltransferase [Candidatus Parcubacteria bacterium]